MLINNLWFWQGCYRVRVGVTVGSPVANSVAIGLPLFFSPPLEREFHIIGSVQSYAFAA